MLARAPWTPVVSVAGPHDGATLHALSVWHREGGRQGPPGGPLESSQSHGHGEMLGADVHNAVQVGIPVDSVVSEPWITHPILAGFDPTGHLLDRRRGAHTQEMQGRGG